MLRHHQSLCCNERNCFSVVFQAMFKPTESMRFVSVSDKCKGEIKACSYSWQLQKKYSFYKSHSVVVIRARLDFIWACRRYIGIGVYAADISPCTVGHLTSGFPISYDKDDQKAWTKQSLFQRECRMLEYAQSFTPSAPGCWKRRSAGEIYEQNTLLSVFN